MLNINLEKFPDIIKKLPFLFFSIMLFSAMLLIAPEEILVKLGLFDLIERYRSVIGIVFLVSSIINLSQILTLFYGKYKGTEQIRIIEKNGKKYLNNLTDSEKILLSQYIDKKTRTSQLSITSGITKGLEHQKILYRASDMGTMMTGFAYNIQPWAWEYLNKNPHLLQLEETEISADDSR